MAGAGGLRSTPNDMLRFLAAQAGETKTPLLPAMRDCRKERHATDAEGEAIGLGWHLRKLKVGRRVVRHTGRTGGYSSFVGFIEGTHSGVVVLGNGSTLVDEAAVDVLKHLVGPAEGKP